MHEIPELDRKGLRKFGFTTGSIFAILFGLLFPWLFETSYPTWPWLLAAILITLAILSPTSLNPIYKNWMRLGLVMNRIVTPVIMGVLFFLAVTPTGIIMRLTKHDPMARRIDKKIDTYRISSKRNLRENMERPF